VDLLNRLASWDGVEGQRKVKSFATLIAPTEMFDCAECFDCFDCDDFTGRCGIVSGRVPLFEAQGLTVLSVAFTDASSGMLSFNSLWQSRSSASTAGMETVFDRSTGLLRMPDFWACYPETLAKDGLSRTLQLPHSFLI
jgi:hypothetical protein